MNKLMLLIRTLFNHPFVRFAMVGGFACGIHYGVYLLALNVIPHPTLCYIVAFAVSVTCNFFLSSWFTFRVQPSWPRAVQFLGAHLINLVNELLLLNLFLWIGISKYYAPVLVFATAFPINFFMVRFALKNKILQRLLGHTDSKSES